MSSKLFDFYATREGLVSDKWAIYLAEYERLFSPMKETLKKTS